MKDDKELDVFDVAARAFERFTTEAAQRHIELGCVLMMVSVAIFVVSPVFIFAGLIKQEPMLVGIGLCGKYPAPRQQSDKN